MIFTLQLAGSMRVGLLSAIDSSGYSGSAIQLYRYGALSLAASTPTDVTFDALIKDQGGFWSPSSNSERLTVPESGWYFIAGSNRWAGAAGAQTIAAAAKISGSAIANGGIQKHSQNTSENEYRCVLAVEYLTAGQYFTYNVVHYGFTVDTMNGKAIVGVARASATSGTGAAVRRNATQSLTGPGSAAVSFDTEDVDEGGCYSGGSPTRLTVPIGKDGWYVIAGSVEFQANGANNRAATIRLNGTTDVGRQKIWTNDSSNTQQPSTGAIRYLVGGDYIEVIAYNGITGAQTLKGRLSMSRMATSGGVSVSHNTTQSCAGADAITACTFNTEVKNTDGLFSSGTPTRFTVPVGASGWYALVGSVQFAALNNSLRQLSLRLNGSYIFGATADVANSTHGNDPGLTVGGVQYLVEGAYVELIVTNSNAAANNISGATFAMVRIPGSDYPVTPTEAVAAHIAGSSAEAITTGTDTAMTLGSAAVRDNGSFFSAGTPTRVTVPSTAWYVVAGSQGWDQVAGADFDHQAALRIDGTTRAAINRIDGYRDAAPADSVCMAEYLTASQYVEYMVKHARGSNLNLTSGEQHLGIAKLPLSIGGTMSQATNSAITSGTGFQPISFTTEVRDDGGCIDIATFPTRLTVPAGHGGIWLFTGYAGYDANTTSGRRLGVCIDGSTGAIQRNSGVPQMANSANTVAVIYVMRAGQYAELKLDQNSGGTRQVNPARFSGVKIASTVDAFVSASNTATQSRSSGVDTPVVFNSLFDPSAYMTGASASRFYVPKFRAGWYFINGTVQWAASTGGYRYLRLRVNGSTMIAKSGLTAPGAFNDPMQNVAAIYYLNEGDYVELMAQADSTQSLQTFTRFQMGLISG